MIDLYYWPTPNGHKVTIFLEEADVLYSVFPIDIGAGEQFNPEFLKISPNNRMPAIIDHEGPDGKPLTLFESGAILFYLADKTGRFMPAAGAARYQVIQWLMFQMGGVGPMFGQYNHFVNYAPDKIPYAVDRYTKEAARLCRVMDKRLSEAQFLAGEYSIADMACFPWVRLRRRVENGLDGMPHLTRWLDEIEARPAVQRALAVMADRLKPLDKDAWRVLFGDKQFQAR